MFMVPFVILYSHISLFRHEEEVLSCNPAFFPFQATVICDLVTLYVLKKGSFYRDKKYFYVTGDDAFKVNSHYKQTAVMGDH